MTGGSSIPLIHSFLSLQQLIKGRLDSQDKMNMQTAVLSVDFLTFRKSAGSLQRVPLRASLEFELEVGLMEDAYTELE